MIDVEGTARTISPDFRALTCEFCSVRKDSGVDEGDGEDDGKDSGARGIRGDGNRAVAGRRVRNRVLKSDTSHTLARQHVVSCHGGLISMCRDAPISSKVAVRA